MQSLNTTEIKNKLYTLFCYLILFFSSIVRFFLYLQNRPLWHDECLLAINLSDVNLFGLFLPLDNNQSAPCLFLVLSKILTFIFGEGEQILRLLPFLFSVASIFVFYFLTKKVFSNKLPILLANFLFAFNLPLMYYSQEFKQYGVEVFFTVFSLLVFCKISFQDMSIKKACLKAFVIFLPFLFSFPYVFMLCAYIVCELFNPEARRSKAFWVFIFANFIFFIGYYFLILLPQKLHAGDFLLNYWNSGFVNLDFSALVLLIDNLKYFFVPNSNVLFILVLIILGFARFLRHKTSLLNIKILNISIISIIIAVFAAILHVYPIKERLALWCLPLVIVLISYVFDFKITKKSFTSFFLYALFFIFAFCSYNVKYLKNIAASNVYFVTKYFHSNEDAREAMMLLKNNYGDLDVIVVNNASVGEFKYYCKRLNFSCTDYIVINPENYSKQDYFNMLDELAGGKNYIFYHSYDYYSSMLSPFLDEWIYKNAKFIYFIQQKDRTYVAKIKL